MNLILLGKPVSTNTIYKYTCRGSFPAGYMSKEGKVIKESYQWQLKSQWKKKPFTSDVDLRMELFLNRQGKIDIDNFSKIVLDSCTGIVWNDDSQIQSLLIIKNYDKKNPRIELDVN